VFLDIHNIYIKNCEYTCGKPEENCGKLVTHLFFHSPIKSFQ
jgi:hypothetical protein